jgi:hypothetical protein
MLQCLDGVKHLLGVLLKCCDIDLKQPKGLEDPEVLARETVCTSKLLPRFRCCHQFFVPSTIIYCLPFVLLPGLRVKLYPQLA